MRRTGKRASVEILMVWLLVLGCAAFANAQARTQDRATQAAITPDEALKILLEGNTRFAAGLTLRRDLEQQVKETSGGQYPFAVIVGCIDSRVSPELVLDTGIGDVFSTRTAGSVVDEVVLGGIEYATKVAGAKLVLGHTGCGAVNGACDGVSLGHLTKTLSLLAPAIAAAKGVPGTHDSSNGAYVSKVTQENVRLTARSLVDESEVLSALVAEGKLRVVAAIYDVASGQVSILD